tara:strand:- start:327 stop:968 length:642 start_codon:yes stop_codon:yes gene_type:complete
MIISHKLKFIFIHIHKCAGTSITKVLDKANVLGPEDIVIGCTKKGEELEKAGGWNGLDKHSTALEIREAVGEEVWNSYFKFTIVRNPWDRAVSTYHWWLKTKYNGEDGKGDIIRSLGSLGSFEKFVMSKHMYHDNCTDRIGGNLDYVGRFEHVRRSFAYFCGRMGLPDLRLTKNNKTEHDHFSLYYNDETEDRIERIFAKDISAFNYKFGAAP